jgi:predicted metal-binding membrane protein
MTSAFQQARGEGRRRWVIAFIVVPAAIAWGLLWWMGSSPSARLLGHVHGGTAVTHHGGDTHLIPLLAVGWVVMTAAMMLPTTAPLLAVFRTVVGGRREQGRLLAMLLLGYMAAWTVVGFGAIVLDQMIHVWFTPHAASTADIPWLTVLVLAGAGIYQFTPLKKRCVTECRSPFLFVSKYWRGGNAYGDSFRLGTMHGWFCVGCCWTLMVVMFMVGMGNLGWMFAFGAVMALEKNVARAAFLGPVVGVGLIVAAGVVAAA